MEDLLCQSYRVEEMTDTSLDGAGRQAQAGSAVVVQLGRHNR
jgi:hypothetical protein